MNRMQERYNNEVAPALFKSFNLKNVMQVPRIEKIVVNIGLGEAMDNPKVLDAATADLMQITGQKPVQTKARKSIANFKLREGRLIGAKVTLRGPRMWAFIDRLLNIALPVYAIFAVFRQMLLMVEGITHSVLGINWFSLR